MFDFRGHGGSQGGRCAGGLTEDQDVRGAVDKAFKRIAAEVPARETPQVGVVGFGLGASAAIAAVGREKGGAEVLFLIYDELATKRGKQDQSFTVAGYGLQSVVPTLQADLVRYRGTVKLVDVNGTAGIPAGTAASFSNNPGEGNGSGGICFGDSGGPIFHGDSNVIAAVNSYVLNLNCVGIGGGYRVDTADDQAFINQFLD